MWSSTNQRIKALMAARAREKERLNRPIHVLRADVTLRVQNETGEIPVLARALLNDFTLNGITLYAASPLAPNVDLVLELEDPRTFRILGRVIWCQYQSTVTHVLTRQTFPYRVGIAFKFQSAEEETEFKKFCDDMLVAYSQKGHLKVLGDPTKIAAPAANTPAASGSEPEAVTAPTEASAAAETPAGEGAAPAAQAAPAEGEPSVTDVLNQLGVEVPSEEKKAA